jgi:L-rhamnose mutarotase
MERVCFLLRVRPEMLADYKERHKHVWPEMLNALSETGWHNYSLFLRDDGLLIGYLETGDFQQALKLMAEQDVNERWQREMKSFFMPAEGRPDEMMERIEEVFHLV